MTKILFVCHGNICRSPMAEYFMKDIVRREGLEKRFEIASAATATPKRYACSWTTPTAPAMLPIRGTPVTLKQPGAMCPMAAAPCWKA